MAKKLGLLFIVIFLFGSSIAYAATGLWTFTFVEGSKYNTSSVAKGTDGDQHAYFTLLNDCSGHSFMTSSDETDVLGIRVYKTSNNASMTDYHTFSNLVTAYPISYTTTAAGSVNYYMKMQVDSASYDSTFKTNGRWTP